MAARTIVVVGGRFGSLVQRGLRQVIGEQRDLALEAIGLGEAALEVAVTRGSVDVVILDELTVAGSSGPGLLKRLRAHAPPIGLLVLASRPTRAYVEPLLTAGASACIAQGASEADLVKTIHLAAKGHGADFFADQAARRGEPRGASSLTPREHGVLRELCLGRSNAQIALELHISVETVRTHVAHIYAKLGIKSRTELRGIDLAPTETRDRRDSSKPTPGPSSKPRSATSRVRLTIGAHPPWTVHTLSTATA